VGKNAGREIAPSCETFVHAPLDADVESRTCFHAKHQARWRSAGSWLGVTTDLLVVRIGCEQQMEETSHGARRMQGGSAHVAAKRKLRTVCRA